MKKFLQALKIGYKIFEHLEASGLDPKLKGVPLSAIEKAAKNAAAIIIASKQ